jgi:homoserine dehydrogenase
MILLFGFGNVGRAYAQLLYSSTELRITGAFDSRGGVIRPGGFTREEMELLLRTQRGGVASAGLGRAASIDEALEAASILVDASPPDYESGEPALSLYRRALARGMAVVTANKAPLALRFRELASARLLYKATVMAGTPLIDLIKGLPPQRILSVRGILNGSTNYVLTRVYRDGVSFERAVLEARERGISERDPRLDLEGFDPAAKVAIVANTLGLPMALKDVKREPLALLGPETRYVAGVDLRAGEAYVRPERLGPGDPLLVDYAMNSVEITTDVNTIVVKGKGAGVKEAAYALINDTVRAAALLGLSSPRSAL